MKIKRKIFMLDSASFICYDRFTSKISNHFYLYSDLDQVRFFTLMKKIILGRCGVFCVPGNGITAG